MMIEIGPHLACAVILGLAFIAIVLILRLL